MSTETNLKTHLLDGRRFTDLATRKYIMPAADFNNVIASGTTILNNMIQWYVSDFIANQQDRIYELQRYYLSDNDIHYQPNKQSGKANNKIASSFARFITNTKTGYFLGNPIQYKIDTNFEDLQSVLETFNDSESIDYHDKLIKKDLSITGRAFELLYADPGTTNIHIKRIDPSEIFMIYDSTLNGKPLCAVRFFDIETFDADYTLYDVYTNDTVYHFKGDEIESTEFLSQEENIFAVLPVVEYANNEERIGDWEFELDNIDAYDKGMSEMANSQENFTNAKLVITGEFDLAVDNSVEVVDNSDENNDPDSETEEVNANTAKTFKIPAHPDVRADDNFLWLKPYTFTDDVTGQQTINNPTAQYLVKELNAAGWETYMSSLQSQILQSTNTPDVSDEAFSGNSSGVALSYKLWGSDQDRKMQESLFSAAIKDRLSIMIEYWQMLAKVENNATSQNVSLVYSPNLPKSDSEKMQVITAVNALGKVSDDTILEMLSQITGISDTEEEIRIQTQQDSQTAQAQEYDPANFVQQVQNNLANTVQSKNSGQTNDNSVDPRVQAIADLRAKQAAAQSNS